MTYDETISLMSLFKAAYPTYYRDMKRKDAESTVSLWHEMLECYELEHVLFASKRLIAESRFNPTISDVIERVKELIQPQDDNAEEAWAALYKAAGRASIVTTEEFESLPYEVQKFCGSLSGLRELGRSDTFSTVTRGQFFKRYDILRRRRETQELISPQLREAISGVATESKPELSPKSEETPDKMTEACATSQESPQAPPIRANSLKDIGLKYEPLSEDRWVEIREEKMKRLKEQRV